MERDPVCGMLVDPGDATGSREYQGHVYYFCSPACLAKFDQAPQRYVSPPSPPPSRQG
jgi:Cu+-exporting ATPase